LVSRLGRDGRQIGSTLGDDESLAVFAGSEERRSGVGPEVAGLDACVGERDLGDAVVDPGSDERELGASVVMERRHDHHRLAPQLIEVAGVRR
jgi:hypothetical protein